jgi:hypothetical protein
MKLEWKGNVIFEELMDGMLYNSTIHMLDQIITKFIPRVWLNSR